MAPNEVAKYIYSQPSPQKEVCERLRAIILDTIPGIHEKIKLGVPYFGDEFYIVSLRDHVNLGYTIKFLKPSELRLLTGTGKTTRVLELRSIDEIEEAKVRELLHLVWQRKVRESN